MPKTTESNYQINGRVISQSTKRGIAGVRVEAWDKDLIFNDLVGSAVTDANGAFRIEFAGSYFRELFFDRKPDLFFKVYSGTKLIKSTQDSVMWNVSTGAIPVEISVPWSGEQPGGDAHYHVSGKVTSPDRPGVGGLRVEIIDRNVGKDIVLAETKTDERGHYDATFTPSFAQNGNKSQPDVQAKVYSGNSFLGASDVVYNASQEEKIDVILPANSTALASEYETLTRALAAHFGGRLSDLKESDERQDISYLANKSGWDARAVALASLADKFSQDQSGNTNTSAIPPAFYYALFRSGLPANPDTLYNAAPQAVERIWNHAITHGMIPESLKQEVSGGVETFRRIGAQKLLTGPPAAGTSSLRDLLVTSQLNESQQGRFADLYTTHRTDLPKFWESIRTEFGDETAKQLQFDGKLSFLTINNAPLLQKLRNLPGDQPLSDPIDLAQKGFHRSTQWIQLLGDEVPVPKAIPGKTAEEKKRNYADYLAAQVRLSFPTASLAELVRSGDMPVKAPEGVNQFFSEHDDFEIGLQPVQQYIARNQLNVADETVTEIKRLQRVYQITPNDKAAAELLRNDLDSAYKIVRFDREEFVQRHTKTLGEAAALTYDRAAQVHGTVLNLAMSYLTARRGISLGSTRPEIQADNGFGGLFLNPQPQGSSADNADDVIAYATLEDLFGEMDFCACDHCRSVLSPAAYLVDLLLFIDKPELNDANPLQIFLSRRPDVEHLPLTCENTNTAMPYIDVVNETLEYFVASSAEGNPSMEGYIGHDTNGVVSEELLASPQFVIDLSYRILQDQHFPMPLPFHQPLENLRRYFEKFESPLTTAMRRLRRNIDLERGANPYGWRDIFMEELSLSRSEYEILTNSTTVPLAKMYGFPDGTADAAVIEALSNAKQFTRRVGITYEDIVEILKTRFVNPNSDLVPKLDRLGLSFSTLRAFKDGDIDDIDDLLPQGAGAPDPADYPGGIEAWISDDDNFDRIMRIITLTDTTADENPCNFETLEFRYSEPADDTSTRLGAVEFIRLMRFIRLWKKLGWTIEQTDTAICSLFPEPPLAAGDIDTTAELDEGFLTLLPRLGILVSVMTLLNLKPKRDLLSLLACWSPLGTHGDEALYRQMFLSSAMLAQDAEFDVNGAGEFLQDNTQKLLGHADALRAAFGLTADELSQILDALGFGADFVDVPYDHGQPNLEQVVLDTAPGIGYDNVTHRLSFTGALSDTTRIALRDLAGVTAAFQDAVNALYAANQATLTTLTLDNISAIYRRGWLARKMKLSVRELLLLIELTGLDPFASANLTNPDIVRLIELAQALKDRSLKSAAALYLIWNQDLSGKSTPDSAQVIEFARTLRGDFVSIEEQFAAVEDPDGEIARARMTLVYGAEATDTFFSLIDEIVVFDVSYTHSQPTLENAITTLDRHIAYDDFRHRLSHTGLLSSEMRDQLIALAGVGPAFPPGVEALFARSEDVRGSFFGRYPELKPLFESIGTLDETVVLTADYTHSDAVLDPEILAADSRIAYDGLNNTLSYSGILTPTRRQNLQSVPDISAEFIAALDALFLSSQEEKGEVLAALQPELALRRKRQQALQRFSAAATTDLNFTQVLLDAADALFPLHAAGDPTQPALNDILALETPGLAAQFFFRNTATGAVDLTVDAVATLDYGPSNPLPANPTPGDTISGIWSGHVETPEAGFYNFVIETDASATVTLSLGGEVKVLTRTGNVWRNSGSLELKAGTLYEIVLTVENVSDSLSLKWETPKRPREVIPGRHLYPSAIFLPFAEIYTRFLKVVSLAQALRLTANETNHFATAYQVDADGWLNALATSGNPTPSVAAALLTPFVDLLNFARIKSQLSPNDESLLDILKDPASATATNTSLLYTLTRWDPKSLADLLDHFSATIADLSGFSLFQRVYDAFGLIHQSGISAGAMIKATTNEPTSDTVRSLQSALRARYETADWRSVVQPINDTMRALQRDALVAYILHMMRSNTDSEHIDTADKLFEYFLMDVEMEPCMQTSRIRHALSSVQLFIERCLMNLEPGVPSSEIIAKRWDWMKRYRVWEANRKVFLYPENWLEPELRDNKSSFFKEIESQLLQSDITEETAAKALLDYLSKLEEVAQLEPCGIYHIEPTTQTAEIDHVIARTSGATRKYFYRRREGGDWTPWEKIDLEIEDNPIIPVVWRDRLLLFWLRIIKQGPDKAKKPPSNKDVTALKISDLPSDPSIKVKAVLCWSEYYNGKWQPMKTSDVNRPAELGDSFPNSGSSAFTRSDLILTTEVSGDPDSVEGDELRVLTSGSGTTSFVVHNTYSLPVREEDEPESEFGVFPVSPAIRFIDSSEDTLIVRYYEAGIPWHFGIPLPNHNIEVLRKTNLDRTVEPHHDLQKPWEAPFFYVDRRHVFFVTTKEMPARISDYLDFGVLEAATVDPGRAAPIGDLVWQFEERPGPPPEWDDDRMRFIDPAINSSPVRQLISEDANIRFGIGSTNTITFEGKQIGPQGMILESTRKA